MNASLRPLCLGLLLLASTLASAGDAHISINVKGTKREYLLHVPPAYEKGHAAPLLLALHGGEGRPRSMPYLTGLSDRADAEGFLVAYPAGIGRHWNDGRAEVGAVADDVSFLSAVIDDIASRYDVDRARVFATGISNGAFMSSRLACGLSERVRAVALVAGTISEALQTSCRPTHPVAVIMFLGTEDPLVPYEGGNVRRNRGKVLGAGATAAFWAGTNGCSTNAERKDLPVTHPSDPTRITVTTYSGCPRGADVLLYTIRGGGHTWPGGRAYAPSFLVGEVGRQVDASEVMWRFFREQASH